MLRFMILSMLSLWLLSCATIDRGTTQELEVDVLNVPEATCRGTDAATGHTYVWAPLMPRTITVERSAGPLTIVCEHQGFDPGEWTLEATNLAGADMAAQVPINILMGPLMPIGFAMDAVGAVVDNSTGAAYAYPEWFKVVLKPDATASPETQAEYHRFSTQLEAEIAEAEAQAQQEAAFDEDEAP